MAKLLNEQRVAPIGRAEPAQQDSRPLGAYPRVRMRRNRRDPWTRRLVAENRLTVDDLIWPLFVQRRRRASATPIASMPGVERLSIDLPGRGGRRGGGDSAFRRSPSFPRPTSELKTPDGDEAVNPDNLICRAVRAVKAAHPEIGVICDVALDPYTSHGQDGLVRDGYVVNDENDRRCSAGRPSCRRRPAAT